MLIVMSFSMRPPPGRRSPELARLPPFLLILPIVFQQTAQVLRFPWGFSMVPDRAVRQRYSGVRRRLPWCSTLLDLPVESADPLGENQPSKRGNDDHAGYRSYPHI
jgi:hypothetical protein